MRTIEMQFPLRPDLAENSSTRERWTNFVAKRSTTLIARPGNVDPALKEQRRPASAEGFLLLTRGNFHPVLFAQIRAEIGRDAAGVSTEKSSGRIPGNVMKITGNSV